MIYLYKISHEYHVQDSTLNIDDYGSLVKITYKKIIVFRCNYLQDVLFFI